MKIVVLANEKLMEELVKQDNRYNGEVIWIERFEDFENYSKADGYIDLLFENDEARVQILKKLNGLVIVNSVVDTLEEINADFVRINGWPGFLESSITEASGSKALRPETEQIFSLFHKKIEWLPDEPGFISARVISMIINEAVLAYNEGVSSKEDIDTAMKLGTNYPYGPFEWMERIGSEKVKRLLVEMTAKKAD
jgi:3-hydroxybutyryl-CoA dehydrogenase